MLTDLVDLFTNSGFSVGNGWYFPGILPIDTEGSLARLIWYISVSIIWLGPFFQKKGGSFALFLYLAPLLRKKGIPAEFFKKRVPAKSSKGVPTKAYEQKYQPDIPTGQYW
jgi:hypothetical protein